MKHFVASHDSLRHLDPAVASRVIASAADMVLVLDPEGRIVDLAVDDDDPELGARRDWIGRPWIETVTPESREKIRQIHETAAAGEEPRWRQVNHPSDHGADIPVMYSALRLSEDGGTIAVGRDLRTVAELQQRLIEAQQSLERDYARLRHIETRYRLLFQMSSEAVLIVDALTYKVLEANPAATKLLGDSARRLIGRVFPQGVDAEGNRSVQHLLAAVGATGRGDEATVRLGDAGEEVAVAATLFRQESTALFLVRLTPTAAAASEIPESQRKLLELVDAAADGVVVTDSDGRVETANSAFLDMVQLATEEQARGQSLDVWLGRPGVDLNVLLASLRERGTLRLFATTLRGSYGAVDEVEISAVSLDRGGRPGLGFMVRSVGRRLMAGARGTGGELPRSVEQLTELVGRVSLKEIVRETTEVIERLCIEAALELTGDNRASAAEMLGLSRQSLYVKLRRYGFGDLAEEGGA
ncbi:MAG: transcriptional regulator PpsR [Azospirillaceae bacterium]